MTPLQTELKRLKGHAHLGSEWLQLIEALECAVEALTKYKSVETWVAMPTNYGHDLRHAKTLLAREELAKIEQLICGGTYISNKTMSNRVSVEFCKTMANWGALNSPVIKMLEEALNKIDSMKTQTIYNHSEDFMSGANFAFCQSAEEAREALNQLAELRGSCGGGEK